jgi:pimeloyl-ACP methyl ester carboxylesterase
LKLAYERSGRGTPLVLIHGYPLDHGIWNPLVPLLEKDFDLILPDLRGFGESQAATANFGMEDMAADIAALLDRLGIERAALAGHSMGGYVALAFARAYPQRVRGLGLVSSQAPADPPERKAGRYQTAEQVDASGVAEVAAGMPGKLTTDPHLQATLKEMILRQPAAGVAGALRAMAERPDATPYLPGFEFPVVTIHGRADMLIPIERAREVAAAVHRGRLVEIEAVGHMPMMEDTQETARALEMLL